MDIEPSLVLWVETAQNLWVLATDLIVVLGQVRQAPLTQLVGIVDLKTEWKKVSMV